MGLEADPDSAGVTWGLPCLDDAPPEDRALRGPQWPRIFQERLAGNPRGPAIKTQSLDNGRQERRRGFGLL